MKILRKISGLFLAFMLIFAVLFVIAPQEEVKADEINTLQDLSNTSWILNDTFVANENFDIKLNASTSNTVIMELITVNSFETMTLFKSNITSNNSDFFGIAKSTGYTMTANINGTTEIIYFYFAGGGFTEEFNGEANILNIYDMSNVTENSTNLSFVEWLKLNATLNTANKYSGTQVLNTGTLDYLYFNTLLPNSEINNILATLNYYEGDFGELIYPVAFSTYADIALFVLKNGNEYNISVNGELDIYNSLTGFSNDFENPFNAYGIPLDSEVQGIPIGNENDKLSSLFSTSPFEIVNFNYITIIDNVNDTSYEIEYQEGYTLEANNIYLNALEYEEYIPDNYINNKHNADVKYVRTFKNWVMISLSGSPRSYDITLPFTFTSQYSGEDWLLYPQYEENDYIPYEIIIHYLNNDGSEYIEFTTMYGAVPFADGATITNTLSPFSNYSLIIEGNNTLLYPTINYEVNAFFNSLLLDNNKLVFSSALTGTSVSRVWIRPYIKYNENEFEVGDTITLDKTGNYNTALNDIEFFQIEIFARSNGSASGDTGDINVNSAFKTFFNLVSDFLNMKLGFITLGEIIGLVLAISLLGFIFKVWNGANNG